MALRLILVSIVAGLGMTPPEEHELAAWTLSVQTWLEARCAVIGDQLNLTGEAFASVAEAPAPVPGYGALVDELLAEIADELVDAEGPAQVVNPDIAADHAYEKVVDEMVAEFFR